LGVILLILVPSVVGLGAGLGGSFSLYRRSSASPLLRATTSGASLAAASELSAYLDSDIVNQYDDDFNILNWWHAHKLLYRVLSILARDVMIVPVSTILSQSAFSTTGRIDAGLQHAVKDQELEDYFQNLFLDEEYV
jgi:hypothetical protein